MRRITERPETQEQGVILGISLSITRCCHCSRHIQSRLLVRSTQARQTLGHQLVQQSSTWSMSNETWWLGSICGSYCDPGLHLGAVCLVCCALFAVGFSAEALTCFSWAGCCHSAIGVRRYLLEEIPFWNHRFSGGNVDICWSENALVTDGCVGDIVHRRVSLYRQGTRRRKRQRLLRSKVL